MATPAAALSHNIHHKPVEARPPEKEYLTTVEACADLRIARRTLLKLCHRGGIPFYTYCGKFVFKRSDIENFRAAHRVGGTV